VANALQQVDEAREHIAKTQTYAPAGFDTSTSVCVMAIPENDADLPGPEDPKHATLLYLGHMHGDGAPSLHEYKNLLSNVCSIAARSKQRFTAKVTGIEQLGDEGAHVWMLDSPELAAIRDDLLEIDSEIASLYEDGTFTKYDPYKPHVTIGYDTKDAGTRLVSEDLEEAEQVKEIAFDRIALWWGEEVYEWTLGNPFGYSTTVTPNKHKTMKGRVIEDVTL